MSAESHPNSSWGTLGEDVLGSVEGGLGISTCVWIDESLEVLMLFARLGGESREIIDRSRS